jgi:hypothetical protein
MVAVAALGTAAAAPPANAARSAELRITVRGLPAGEPSAVRVVGPGYRKTVRGRVRTIIVPRARPGAYRVAGLPLKLRRNHGPIRRGASARTTGKATVAKVFPRRTTRATLRYDRIVNPVRVTRTLKVLSVGGPPGNPTSLLVAGRGKGFRRGELLSIPPGAGLPRGVLSTVTDTGIAKGNTTVTLRAATIFEAAPNYSFDVPGTVGNATIGSVLGRSAGCKLTGVDQEIFSREIKDVRFTGGWTTRRLFGRDVPVGMEFEVSFRPEVGVTLAKIAAAFGGECKATIPVSGMAGPIPVTASIGGKLSASAGASADLSAKGSVQVRVGAKTIGVPPALVWLPSLSVEQPRFTLTGGINAEAKAGIGLDVKAGLGNETITSIALKTGTSVDFKAVPGTGCTWDVNAGSLSVEGKVLGWTVDSPSSPPLFSRNLWKQPCGAAPPPPPPPAPTPEPAPPAPEPAPEPESDLLRARMTWDTATDVDLYVWDADGNQVSYRAQDAIPGARLVEDITPGFGPEEFYETSPKGRGLTYGVCMYRDETAGSTAVQLALTDPDGTQRTVPHTLGYEGDSAVIATSPDGGGYQPDDGWCRYNSE